MVAVCKDELFTAVSKSFCYLKFLKIYFGKKKNLQIFNFLTDPKIIPSALQGPLHSPLGRGLKSTDGTRQQHKKPPPLLTGATLRPPPRGLTRPQHRHQVAAAPLPWFPRKRRRRRRRRQPLLGASLSRRPCCFRSKFSTGEARSRARESGTQELRVVQREDRLVGLDGVEDKEGEPESLKDVEASAEQNRPH